MSLLAQLGHLLTVDSTVVYPWKTKSIGLARGVVTVLGSIGSKADEHPLRQLWQVSRERWSSMFMKTPARAGVPCQWTPSGHPLRHVTPARAGVAHT